MLYPGPCQDARVGTSYFFVGGFVFRTNNHPRSEAVSGLDDNGEFRPAGNLHEQCQYMIDPAVKILANATRQMKTSQNGSRTSKNLIVLIL